MVVTQTAGIGGLTPGHSVALSGRITNAAGPDAKAGSVMAAVVSVGGDSNPGAAADYWIDGAAVVDANVPTGTSGIAWSGLTLHYANSANDQNSGKSAQVNIKYTLTDTPVVTAVGHNGGAWTGAGANNTAAWANTSFYEQFNLVKTSTGYILATSYNGTFTGNAGIASPNNSGVMGSGITGTLTSAWKSEIKTTMVAHQPAAGVCTTAVPCSLNEFFTATFGSVTNTGTSPVRAFQPNWEEYSWMTTFNAGPDHGTYVATNVSPANGNGDEVAVGTGDIK